MGLLDKIRGRSDDDDDPTFGEKMMGDIGPNAGRDWKYDDRWRPTQYRYNKRLKEVRESVKLDGSNPWYRIYFYAKFEDYKYSVVDLLQINSVAVLHLIANSSKPVRQDKVPASWTKISYAVSAEGTCQGLYRDGYLQDIPGSEKLMKLKADELKDICVAAGVPPKGKKQQMVDAICASSPDAEARYSRDLPGYYVLTEKGQDVIDRTPWVGECLNGEIWYDLDLPAVPLLRKTCPDATLLEASRELYLNMAEAFLAYGRKVDFVGAVESLGRLYIMVDPAEACHWLAQLINACNMAGLYDQWHTLAIQICERTGLSKGEVIDRTVDELLNHSFPDYTKEDRIPDVMARVLSRF